MDLTAEMIDAIREDLPNIEAYIDIYAFDEDEIWDAKGSGCSKASAEEILQVWAAYKEDLFKLLGHNVMLHKDICIKAPIHELTDQMDDIMEHGSGYKFYCDLVDKIHHNTDEYMENTDEETIRNLSNFCYRCVSSANLAENTVKYAAWDPPAKEPVHFKSGHSLQIPKTVKPIRFLSKVAKELEIDSFEQFRIDHSRVLNESKLSGRLTLSIHPLDFMTMSDNNCGWSSCMSWSERGDYRQGTVEMMNSPYVLIAYLEAEEPMNLFYNSSRNWNNKKWRCLFIYDGDAIVKVKGYPYQNADLENIVLDWIAELAAKSEDPVEFLPNDISLDRTNGYMVGMLDNCDMEFSFSTGTMYNDIGHSSQSHMRVSKKYFEDYVNCERPRVKYRNFSGPSQCMWCGDSPVDIAETHCLICTKEHVGCVCCECGESLHEENAWYDDEGNAYCEYCFNETFTTDFMTEAYIAYDNAAKIYFIPTQLWARMKNMITGSEPTTYRDRNMTRHEDGEKIPKFGLNSTFLDTCGLPMLYTSMDNVWNPRQYWNRFPDRKSATEDYGKVNNYFIREYGKLPFVGLTAYGDVFFYYIFDPDDPDLQAAAMFRDCADWSRNSMIKYSKYYIRRWEEDWSETWNHALRLNRGLFDSCFLDIEDFKIM